MKEMCGERIAEVIIGMPVHHKELGWRMRRESNFGWGGSLLFCVLLCTVIDTIILVLV